MKKASAIKDGSIISVIPEYGRQKLLDYAESFSELAELFEDRNEMEEFSEQNKSRQEYLWQKKLYENNDLLARHLKEMSYIMSDVAKESYRYHSLGIRKYKQMAKYLKESGILLKNFIILENNDGHIELNLTMKSQIRENILIEDVAKLLSAAMNMRMQPSRNECLFVMHEWRDYRFFEEPEFHIVTGLAKAVKETEKVSGDNYSFCETKSGKIAAILSDGMGSGEQACEESGKVIDMIERLLESGFKKESAVQIINGALAAGEKEKNMSTVDICELNLYTGDCDFIKVGAACTYIKRDNMVDKLSAGNLPLGIFQHIEPETIHRQLKDGDYIIMLSDGILDALSQNDAEDLLPDFISNICQTNPSDIANNILGYCLRTAMGRIRDDMTVLVMGVWKYA